jgi:site-specific recombinase XerD
MQELITTPHSQLITTADSLELANAQKKHPVTVYLGSKTPAGRASLEGALRFAFNVKKTGLDYMSLDLWRALGIDTFDKLSTLQARLVETGKKPTTINHAMCAIRGVLKVAKRQGLVPREAVEAAEEVEAIKSSSNVLTGREVSKTEVASLFEVCKQDTSPAGRRDSALLAIMWSVGLRRAEVASLTRASVEIEEDEARIVLTGKGRKTREVFIAQGALSALRAWLEVRGDNEGALFGAVSQIGAISLEHMSAQAVYNALEKRQKAAGLKRCTPHDFRRSCAGNFIEAGVDLSTVAELLGHSSVNTTIRYDRRSSERKRRASRLVSTPF